MPNEKFQTRLPDDTAEKVYEYMDEHNVSQSEAIRRLVERGLVVEAADGQLVIGSEGEAVAGISPTVRLIGGATIGLMVLFIFISEVGLI